MKKNFQLITTVALLCLGSLVTTGCFRVSYIERNQYLFHVEAPKIPHQKTTTYILAINNVTIDPAFSGTQFVYRTGQSNYLSDYYNVFFAPPAQQMNEILTRYLQSTELYRYVTLDDDYHLAQYMLQAKIVSLYADYQDVLHPQGVIEMQVSMFKRTDTQPKLIMNSLFKASIPLHSKDSQSLINAWNKGLSNILRDMVNGLKTKF